MPAVKTTPTNWAKDSVLKDQILQALDVTEGQPDLVFTVSVQGHGKYPTEPVLEKPGHHGGEVPPMRTTITPWSTTSIRPHEMDAFVGSLVKALSQREEKTVLVLYGDHLPAWAWTRRIWRAAVSTARSTSSGINFGLEQRDEDLAAYQLSASVLGRLGITTGLMNGFQQTCREEDSYWRDLRMLQYDALYGSGFLYGETGPSVPAEMEMGMVPI